MEKKVYEEPEVTRVEFDFEDRITASGCSYLYNDDTESGTPCTDMKMDED